jgi:uncharacterized membrane protein YsdA (DUF1294 family)
MVGVFIAVIFIFALWALAASGFIHGYALLVYCVLSVTAYGLYKWDKQAAKSGGWRIRESQLHFIALVGGWPGALYAQQHLRHKSKKVSFLLVFWLTVLLNLLLLITYTGWHIGVI